MEQAKTRKGAIDAIRKMRVKLALGLLLSAYTAFGMVRMGELHHPDAALIPLGIPFAVGLFSLCSGARDVYLWRKTPSPPL